MDWNTVLAGLLDTIIVAGSLAASWLWWRASRNQVRRVSRFETLDHADINRLVTALNRTQLLNARAAALTALTTLAAALRLATN